MSDGTRRPMVVSKLWVQALALTFLVGFAILGYLAIRVYQEHAPVPGKVVDESGKVLITRDEIMQGQEAFLTHGLMQYGSVYGHGAYLGPDFTADYLHRQAELMREYQGGGPEAEERVRNELQVNRYNSDTDTLVWTDGQVRAFRELVTAVRGGVPQPQAERGRARAERHPRPRGLPADHGVHRLDGLDRRRPPARPATTRTRTTGRPSRWSETT